MNIFPSDSFTIHTQISTETAWNNLSNSISIKAYPIFPLFSKDRETKPFKGYIAGKKFNLTRALNYRNSFQAEISGEIIHAKSGCAIKIKFSLRPFVRFFLMIWCSLAFSAFLILIFSSLKAQNLALFYGSFIPLAMLGICYLMVKLGFKSDCDASAKILKELFAAS